MRIVTFDVSPPQTAMADLIQVWHAGKRQKSARISFATPELMWQILTARRWEILKALCSAGPASIREVARCVALTAAVSSFPMTRSEWSFRSRLPDSSWHLTWR